VYWKFNTCYLLPFPYDITTPNSYPGIFLPTVFWKILFFTHFDSKYLWKYWSVCSERYIIQIARFLRIFGEEMVEMSYAL
jgi:hypothetical protein